MSVNSVVIVKDKKVKRIKKGGTHWTMNMNLGNPYYGRASENLDKFVKGLRKKGFAVKFSRVYSFSSRDGGTTVPKLYGLEYADKTVGVCFTEKDSVRKLMVVPAKRPTEMLALGSDSRGECFIPLIVVREDGVLKGINVA